MSQDMFKMLEKAQELLAATANSLETLVMDLVTHRIQMMDKWSPGSVLEQDQIFLQELEVFRKELYKEHGEDSN